LQAASAGSLSPRPAVRYLAASARGASLPRGAPAHEFFLEKPMRSAPLATLAALLLGSACAVAPAPTGEPVAAPPAGAAAPADPQAAFWSNLREHCGGAYRGRLILEPPGDDMLTGTEELIVHFRECSDSVLRLPFHIEKEETSSWDRSRTWVFFRTAAGLELRHDHRQPDGTPDESTWYGGHTRDRGAPDRQEFVYTERTAPDGSLLGWRVEIVPGERYTYGTIRGPAWTWRVDFDLTQRVPEPPAPWGH
jgi:hypothetical protein